MAGAERRELNVRELLELERQIYQESIDRVLQQQDKLNTGVLEDFVRRCRPFEEDRERELQVAQNQLQFSQRDALSLFEFDLQQAEDVFRVQREQLKRRLLEGTRRRRAKIEKRLKALDEKPMPKSNVKVQATEAVVDLTMQTEGRLQPKLLEKQLRRAQKRTRRSFNFRHLSDGVLPTPERIVNDVMEECEKLQRNRELQEAARMAVEAGGSLSVRVDIVEDRQKLRYVMKEDGELVEETFGVGDAVVLMSRLTEEDFHGFVAAITTEEVKLVLVCGTHARVAIARLRSGQCILHKQPKDVVSKDKREDDQDEYHAKISPPGVATNLDELLRDPPDARRRAAAVLNRLKRKTTIDIRRGF
ncbi:hypothetical protein PI124_g13858 [Phytophthora idaei]|nr:hypothetical protein PI125_g14079 [Phytophthora idaei]KAG3146542.1 hypothetical protein PI126_g13282 [Phytophthora idaei]KAG3241267.1 hypothetical protein PI124_g13858 [Phytophthora idaei]